MKTSKYGYMIRKLVIAAQEVIVTEDDVIQQKVWKFKQSLILSKKLLSNHI